MKMLRIKKVHFVPMGFFFFFLSLCVMFFCVHKTYLNNPLCTVNRVLVLSAAVTTKKKCIRLHLSELHV